MASILVVVAHPDDEALGCGGTIRRHGNKGDSVFAIHFTDGVGARGSREDDATYRLRAADRCAETLGFEWTARGNFPDNRLDSVPLLDLVHFVESAVEKVHPETVYTHFGGDLNVDHRIVFQATLTALRPISGSSCREIFSFEVPSSTEWTHSTLAGAFEPDTFIDIGATWMDKKAALQAYEVEMRPYPHPRSERALEALARSRGVQAGLEMAEAFRQIRRIVDE